MLQKKTGSLFLVLSILFSSQCLAQLPAVKISVDKNEILIGEQLKLTVTADFSNAAYIPEQPALSDSLLHFELIGKSKIDSVYANGKFSGISQQFTLTSFDSGKWMTPPVVINFSSTGKALPIRVFTDSFPINVNFSYSDTTNQLRDIKPVRLAEKTNNLWVWIAAGILLLALIGLSYWFYRRRKKNKTNSIFDTKLSAYDEAISELEKLHKSNISSSEEIKAYHTKLAHIVKRYLSRKENTLYLNKTTGDILLLISNYQLDKELFSKLSSSLRCGDAVKFAKFIPPEIESRNCIPPVKEFIDSINKNTAVIKG